MFKIVNIDKIKFLAKSQGIKLKFLCQNIGVAESYFGDVKSGKCKIPPDRLEKIAELLHTTPAYLMDETDDPAPIKKEPTIYGELSEDKQALIDLIVSIDEAQTIHAIKLLLDEIQGKK